MSRHIDADRLKKQDVGDWIEHRVFVQNMNDIDRQTILNLPTAQPEMKRGRWFPIFIGEHGYSAGDFRCSVCGAPNKCYCLTKYCPNCGARMDERSDDE